MHACNVRLRPAHHHHLHGDKRLDHWNDHRSGARLAACRLAPPDRPGPAVSVARVAVRSVPPASGRAHARSRSPLRRSGRRPRAAVAVAFARHIPRRRPQPGSRGSNSCPRALASRPSPQPASWTLRTVDVRPASARVGMAARPWIRERTNQPAADRRRATRTRTHAPATGPGARRRREAVASSIGRRGLCEKPS
jgi:hypothetical protein